MEATMGATFVNDFNLDSSLSKKPKPQGFGVKRDAGFNKKTSVVPKEQQDVVISSNLPNEIVFPAQVVHDELRYNLMPQKESPYVLKLRRNSGGGRSFGLVGK